jgi:hypothetical protein
LKCSTVRDLASDALDGLLEPALAARFQAHLESCPACRSFHADLTDSLTLLGELPEVTPRPDFERRLWARIREEEAPVGLLETIVVRSKALVDRFALKAPTWGWAPVGVAAAIVGVVAFMSGPVPMGETPGGSTTLAESRGASDDGGIAESAPSRLAGVAERDAFVVPTREVDTEEFEAGMPRAVAQFLENAPELRLRSPEGYRDSNYRYPIRRVSDPVQYVPVQDGRRLGPPYSVPGNTAQAGATVLSF